MNIQAGTLLIRADGGPSIGLGHIMRCVALVQEWRDRGGIGKYVLAESPPPIRGRLNGERIGLACVSASPGSPEEALETVQIARKAGAQCIVLDGYHFGAEYQRMIKQSGVPVLVIDDQAHSEHYFADVVLNQNLHAHEGLYRRREAYTRLLLGTRFVLLRREFLKWRSWRRRTPVIARRILVTLGGGAHDVVLLQLLEALAPVCVSGLEVLMVRGGGHDGIRKVRAAVEASGLPVRLEQDVWDMSQPMSWCDVAVSAGGSTCWELSFMGVPMATIVLSDNQAEIAASLEKADVGINLGAYDQLSVDRLTGTLSDLLMDERRRARMSRNGRNLVDGRGAGRVAAALASS